MINTLYYMYMYTLQVTDLIQFFIILDGARNASVDNRPKWLWKKFFISNSWWTVASLQRVPGQTTS